MALDDPNITKLLFDNFEELIEVEVKPDSLARLACVYLKGKPKPIVNIIDCAPGIYTVQCKKQDVPKPKIYFEVKLRKSFLPKKNKQSHIKGRYDR